MNPNIVNGSPSPCPKTLREDFLNQMASPLSPIIPSSQQFLRSYHQVWLIMKFLDTTGGTDLLLRKILELEESWETILTTLFNL